MLRAVLFDWGETLVHWEWDDELLAEAHRAGLAALGRGEEADAFTARFRRDWLAALNEEDAAERTDYRDVVRDLLGTAATGADVDRFVEAEHEAWRPAHALVSSAHALLDSLREKGLRLAVVSNAWPEPGRLLRADLERLGIAERIDVAVFADEVGARKPDEAIFRRALAELQVGPHEALFVGDRLRDDVAGAAAVGMTTAQALWFRADDAPADVEPDFMCFTPMDVLTAVRRLASDG
jgi:putative hydrolase of the HAD superfamily